MRGPGPQTVLLHSADVGRTPATCFLASGRIQAGHYELLTKRAYKSQQQLTALLFGIRVPFVMFRVFITVLRWSRRRSSAWTPMLVLMMLFWWACERDGHLQLSQIANAISTKLVIRMGPSKCLTNPGQGRLQVNKQNVSYEEVEKVLTPLGTGAGRFRPRHCVADQKSAIIIPFRKRHQHLPLLLNNLVPYLLRQNRDCTIYVVEQVSDGVFNKALMMNAGFTEAIRLGKYDCFIFHDVDLIPEDDRIPYSCRSDQVVHLVAAIRKYYYHAMRRYIGGVLAFTEQQFRGVNGFSNLYMGWGGEDDDMRFRLDLLSNPVYEVPIQIGRYYSFNHSIDEGNQVNHHRKELLWEAGKRAAIDGLTSLKYTVASVEQSPLFTWVKVWYNPQHYSALFNAVVNGSLEMP